MMILFSLSLTPAPSFTLALSGRYMCRPVTPSPPRPMSTARAQKPRRAQLERRARAYSLSQPISAPRLACSLLESASFSLFSLCSTCAPIKQSHSSHLCRRYNQMSQNLGLYSIHRLWAQDEVRAKKNPSILTKVGK